MKKTLLITFALLCVVVQTAWAQTEVSLSIDNDYTSDQTGYYYVNMPEEGLLNVTQTDIVFKIYDNGGKNGRYDPLKDASILLETDEEYVFEATGKISVAVGDYLYMFDGSTLFDPTLYEGGGNSANIGIYTSTGNKMFVKFLSSYASGDGFELTVRMKPAPKYDINLTQQDGGTWTVDGGLTESILNKKIMLVFTPDNNRDVSSVKLVKTDDTATEVTLTKEDDTHYSFIMPKYDVTLVPEPYDWLWTSGNTTCRFSIDGTFKVSPVPGTNGAMANYPTISAPWQNFIDNNRITQLVFDPGVTAIGQYAFLNLKLPEVKLTEGLLRIRDQAFRYANITKITIPSTVVSITGGAFYCCDQLSDVYCYAPADNLSWGGTAWDFKHGNEGYIYETKLHVLPKYYSTYQSKFEGKLNVTITNDLQPDTWTDLYNYASEFSQQNGQTITITNEAELARLAYLVNSGQRFQDYTILLNRDLDMSRHNWNPIGNTSGTYFMGTFDGQGHTISGVEVNRSGQSYNGLFGHVGQLDGNMPYGDINNVQLMNSTINGGSNTGGLVGYLHYGQVNSCFTDATVNGETNTGGLVGKIEGGLDVSQTARLDDCLYLGNHVSGTDTNTSHGVFGTSSGSVDMKAFYTNPNMEGKTSRDIYAVKVSLDPSVSNNDIFLEFIHDKTIGYGGNWYCIADGTSTFTISGKDDHQKVTLVSVNGEVIGTEAGTYTIPVRDGVSDYVISASVNLQLLDNADNTTVINQCNNSTYDVILKNRTLYKDGDWNTICLPFSLTSSQLADADCPLKNAVIMKLGDASLIEGTLTLSFDEAAEIVAGKPYIVMWEKSEGYEGHEGEFDLVNPLFKNVTISNASLDDHAASIDGLISFKGLYTPLAIGEDGDNTKLFLGAANTLYYPNAEMIIGSQRGYFQLADGYTCGIPESTANVINNFVLHFDGDATSVIDIEHSPLTIVHEGWYTIDGRKLSVKPTQKGIYILNRKKVVIK